MLNVKSTIGSPVLRDSFLRQAIKQDPVPILHLGNPSSVPKVAFQSDESVCFFPPFVTSVILNYLEAISKQFIDTSASSEYFL